MSLWGVIPVRPLDEGKSRLAHILSGPERLRLNEAFFRHTVDVVSAVLGHEHTLVVTRSPDLLRLAGMMGVVALEECRPWGLNEALEQAAAAVANRGASGILSVSCDLPFLAPDDLRAMLAAAPPASGMVIAGDRTLSGTNALLVAPVGAVAYAYGLDSFAAHLAAARRARLPLQIVRRPGLAFDVDTAGDFDDLAEVGREHGMDEVSSRLSACVAGVG